MENTRLWECQKCKKRGFSQELKQLEYFTEFVCPYCGSTNWDWLKEEDDGKDRTVIPFACDAINQLHRSLFPGKDF